MKKKLCEAYVPKVYIQYNCIPHYRVPIFRYLSKCQEVAFTILADLKTDTKYLKVVEASEKSINLIVANRIDIRIGKRIVLYWQPKAVAMVLKARPDIVIALANPYSLTAWALLILGKLYRIPVLLWGHGLLKPETGIKWQFRKFFYFLAYGQLLYGDFAKDLLINVGFKERRLFPVYNSLDYDKQLEISKTINRESIQKFRSGIGVSDSDGLVIFTGRLQATKRLDMLIHAAKLIKATDKRVHIALIGHGDEREKLEHLAANLGVDDLVHFLGQSYDEEFLGLAVSASDISVIPSGAGLSVMHAMGYGTPVLIHDRLAEHFPEWEAVEEGVSGHFYKYGSVQDLATKIVEAIFIGHSKERMALSCQKKISERYSPASQVVRFIKIVKEIEKEEFKSGNYGNDKSPI